MLDSVSVNLMVTDMVASLRFYHEVLGAPVYFRVDDVDTIAARVPEQAEIVKPLETTWYGMREIWVRDPDGYVLTIGTPHGEPPA